MRKLDSLLVASFFGLALFEGVWTGNQVLSLLLMILGYQFLLFNGITQVVERLRSRRLPRMTAIPVEKIVTDMDGTQYKLTSVGYRPLVHGEKVGVVRPPQEDHVNCRCDLPRAAEAKFAFWGDPLNPVKGKPRKKRKVAAKRRKR